MGLEEWLALGGLVVGVAAVVVAVLQWRSSRPPAPPPPPASPPPPSPLPALLRAQRAYAGALPYLAALGGAAPDLDAVYVTLRAGRIERAAVAPAPPGQDAPAAEPRVTEVDLAEVVAAPGGAVLVGGAGSGKSTVVARIVAEAADRRLTGGPAGGGAAVPVVVPARLLGPSAELARAVAAGLARTTDLAEDDLAALLAAPPAGGAHWLVIVDGLDEIVDGGERRDAVRRVALWLAEPGAPYRMIVTTRPPREGELAPLRAAGAAEFHLRPFDVDGLDAFARRWFAAVHPDGGADLADRFLARVATDRLGGLVRTPLLATIAAVVFGRSLDQPLPAGRASLYEAFVGLSLQRRRSPREVAETDPDDARARVWRGDPSGQALLWELFLHTGDMLGHLADRRLAGDPTPLADLATAWATAPHTWSKALATEADSDRARRLVAADPAWAHLVPALLAETGLVGPAGGGWEFAHPSFTEYLAAQHRALGLADALAAVADGATRGFGLFAVAAAVAREPASSVVATRTPASDLEELLDGDLVDLRTLAEILGDGVPLDPAFQRRAAGDIVARCRDAGDRYGSWRHEETLAAPVAHPYAAARLAEVAGDEDAPAGFRGAAARLLATAGRPDAVGVLLPALDDGRLTGEERAGLAGVAARHGTGPVAARALDTLRALASGDPDDAATRDATVTLVELGTPADRAGILARVGTDRDMRSRYWRVLAAAALARHGDPVQWAAAVGVLEELVTDDILTVEPLAEEGGPEGRRRLAAVAADPTVAPGIRRTAVRALMRFAPPDERESTVELVRGLLAGAGPDDRASYLVDLVTHAPGADRGAAVAFARDPAVGAAARGKVAAALLADGPVAERGIGFDVLRDIAGDADVRYWDREEAIRHLAMDGGPPGRAAVAGAVGPSDPPDVRFAAARSLLHLGDPEERAAGREMLTALVESGRPLDADEWDFVPGSAARILAEEGTAADRTWLARVGADGETRVRLRGDVLGALFRSGDDRERAAAREQLERLVREAGADWQERSTTAGTLAEYGGPAERHRLGEMADDSGLPAGSRYRAAEALAEHGGPADRPSAVRAFAAVVEDETADPWLRHSAAHDLYRHGGPAERADLMRRAEDPSADPRARVIVAAAALRGEGDAHRAGGILSALAADPFLDPEVRMDAVTTLVEHGGATAHEAAVRLGDDPVIGLAVARAFLTALRPVGDAHKATIAGHLTRLLRESPLHSDDSQIAADLLVQEAGAAGTVLAVARDPAAPGDNRLSAAFALYKAGHLDALALLAGDAALAPTLRVPVARWLCGADEGSYRAAGLAALEEIATDPATPGADREQAVSVLAGRFDRAAEVLARLATTPGVPADTRCGAASALAEHGTDGTARLGAEVLADLAAHGPTWWIRLHAVLAVEGDAPVPAGPEAHPIVRLYAARHLARQGDPEGTAVLRAVFADPAAPDEARALAVAMLVEVGEPAEAVAAMSTVELPALVRAEAAIALAEDPPPAAEAAALDPAADAEPGARRDKDAAPVADASREAHRDKDGAPGADAAPGDHRAAAIEVLARMAYDPAAPDDVRASAITCLSKLDRLDVAARVARTPGTPALPGLAATTALLAAGAPGGTDALLPDEPGGRVWLWVVAALNQWGDETERSTDLVAAIGYFGEEVFHAPADDPLLRHLTTADWFDEGDPPYDGLLREVASVLMVMDGDPDLWREAAREVTHHGLGYQRLIARAVLRERDTAAVAELDKTGH